MRFAFLISIVFMLANTALGKPMEHYSGWIEVDGKKIDFSLQLTVGIKNKIHGTSLTGKGTQEETKCRITGKYDPKNGSIFFYETVVLSSKAKFENLNFCLLKATLKKKESGVKIDYTGKFTGYVRGTKKKCATGKMQLTYKKPKKKVLKKVTPPVKKIIVDTLYSNNKSQKSIRYRYTADNIQLKIWDDLAVDGDRISIYFDGKLILKNYELQKLKKRLKLYVGDKSKHYIKVVALNEGKATPNTSKIILTHANLHKEVIAHIKKGEEIYIKLER